MNGVLCPPMRGNRLRNSGKGWEDGSVGRVFAMPAQGLEFGSPEYIILYIIILNT